MNEEPITAEQVTQFARTSATHAERIAAYANHRAAGLLPADAQNKTHVGDVTGKRYELWTKAIRKELGLPPLPARTFIRSPSTKELSAASYRGTHNRWHTARGVSNPDCPECATC